MRLPPFFRYYGGKHTLSRVYPPPASRTIIEPFAGSAGYSHRYHHHDIRLFDVSDTIVGVWSYLLRASPLEVRMLPVRVREVDDLPDSVCQEARWLIGFWLFEGARKPAKHPTSWARSPGRGWTEKTRDRIARQLRYVRHWRVGQASYETLPELRATWFIDPPYADEAGRAYEHNTIDYRHLAGWCERRRGRVIVCERAGAEWLPFRPVARARTQLAATMTEAVWTRDVV